MSCPRPNEKCNEFMCGSSVNGICVCGGESNMSYIEDCEEDLNEFKEELKAEHKKKVLDEFDTLSIEDKINKIIKTLIDKGVL